jgi:UDP-2-acetamido-2-deoxy-ribo-hexuluronate aminotransferase
LQEAYQNLGYRRGAFEISERTSAEFISLPMFPELTSAQIDYVIEGVQEALLAAAVV